jgi:hypothetical protein
MGKPVWQEPLEQLAHFALGLVAPALCALREWNQWPPGDVHHILGMPSGKTEFAPLDRVRDAYRDFTAYLIGAQVAICVLAGLLVWRW